MKLLSIIVVALLLVLGIVSLSSANTRSSSEDSPWLIAFVILIYCGIFLVMGLYYVLLIFALVDIARAGNEGNWKLLWALVSIFAGLIGMAVYFLVGRHERIPPKLKVA